MTQDRCWLSDGAYPIIKRAAEFYRHFPNLRKDGQGVYHLEHTNSGESSWDSRDAPYEVQCLRPDASGAVGTVPTTKGETVVVVPRATAAPVRGL